LSAGIAPAWFAHLIVEGRQVVGLGGYTGPPVDGVIEIPGGAGFTSCVPDYGRDEAAQKAYAAGDLFVGDKERSA